MRLINVDSLELETFDDDKIPRYSILSHRWGERELTFEDMSTSMMSRMFGRKAILDKAFQKLENACRTTKKLDSTLKYLWIDTCCIDKRSSSELSEAINSMYRWYGEAVVCLAFLEDVESPVETRIQHGQRDLGSNKSGLVPFEESVWFTRAWTLQELLAPRTVIFYDRYWLKIGTKILMAGRIASLTKIPVDLLIKRTQPYDYSIASRMSWAAKRTATRVEDLAYSLLGIFGVSMALLYGEREQSFIRLQEEIIKRDLDRSFLLWGLDTPSPYLFARSPAEFSSMDDTQFTLHRKSSLTPFALTNAGLEVELELTWWNLNMYAARVAGIHVYDDPSQRDSVFYILLRQGKYDHTLHRAGLLRRNTAMNDFIPPRARKVTLLRGSDRDTWPEQTLCGFRVHDKSLPMQLWNTERSTPVVGTSKPQEFILSPVSHSLFNVCLQCQLAEERQLFLVVSFNFTFNPTVMFSKEPPVAHWVIGSGDEPEPLWEDKQWAKVRNIERASKSNPHTWACKSINREGVYMDLPDFLTPSGYRIAFYMDFITEPKGDHSIAMWQMAVLQRETSTSKSIVETFTSDRFFEDEGLEMEKFLSDKNSSSLFSEPGSSEAQSCSSNDFRTGISSRMDLVFQRGTLRSAATGPGDQQKQE